MAGYRLEYDHDWELDVASDGRKRRSFLPAPKRGSGTSPTSPQQSFLPQLQQQQQQPYTSHHSLQRQEQQQQHEQHQHSYQQQSYHQQGQTSQHSQSQYQRHYPQRQQEEHQSRQHHSVTSQRSSSSGGGDGGGDGRNRQASSSSSSTQKRSSSGSPHPDFGQGIRVGARIRIGGVKPGIVRYVGTVHLAPGIFCGVELLEADGTHDGEVNGHRYFNCPPKHGIFAPKDKVILDASNPSLTRVASDSDPCYSSTESLAERSNQAFRHFSEGELEAVDCSKIISPTASGAFSPIPPKSSTPISAFGGHQRSTEKKIDLNSTYDVEDLKDVSSPSTRRDFDDLPDPKSIFNSKPQHRSVLPRPKSGLPAPTSSKLPTFSRSLNKTSEQQPVRNQDPRKNVPKHSTPETVTYSDDVSSSGDDQHRISASSRSSEESEEDGTSRLKLSSGVKNQLRGDSRQYLNFTFDRDSRDSLDQDESGSDSNSRDNITYVKYQTPPSKGTTRPSSTDSYPLADSSSHSILNSEILADNSLTAVQPLDQLFHGKLDKRADRRRTSTPIENRSRQSNVRASRSYVVGETHDSIHDETYVASHDYGLEDADYQLSASTSQSVSDIDLPVDDENEGGANGGWDRLYPGQVLTEGGYSCNVLDGDGNSATGLSLPPPSETRSSSDISGIAPGHVSTKHQLPQPPHISESYTVNKLSPDVAEAKSRRHSVPATASRSYTISPARAEKSAGSDKVRHGSNSSSANGGDSSSSGTDPKTESSEEGKGEHVDDSSNGVSPEVSQTLEWDYGQDFDGKLPCHSSDNAMSGSASTGTSESLSDVLRDVSEQSDVIDPELASGTTEDSDQFETPENDFENIDSLEDFPIFGKDPKAIMIDSGISDKDFEFNNMMAKSSTSTICGNSSDDCSREDDNSLTTAKAMGSDSSQETIAPELIPDTPVSVEAKDLPGDDLLDIDGHSQMDSATDGYSNSPGSVISVEEARTICDGVDGSNAETKNVKLLLPSERSDKDTGFSLTQDVLGDGSVEGRGGVRKERPISLLSTTSADTGYAPDTDSEIGTLTTNTPSEWVDRQGTAHPTSYAPIEDYYSLGSPVDAEDFVKKESLALSRALRQQTSIQSTSSNLSDVEDPRELDDLDTTTVCSSSLDDTLVTEKPSVNVNDNTQRLETRDVLEHATHKDTLNVLEKSPSKETRNALEESEIADNTEDDRIEADQAHGPPGSSSSSNTSTRENTPPKLSPDVGEGESIDINGVGDGQTTASDKIETGPEGETVLAVKETPLKANEADAKKPKARKGLVMTKKKMEVIDHKLPNTKVASKLADYIKAPTPVKPKDDKESEENKVSKNIKNISKNKRISVTNLGVKPGNHRAPSVERGGENENEDDSNENVKNRRKSEKIEKPKPVIIKRSPPKSKWDNIMSQIETSKDTVKPKPKSEIKSSLAAYLNTPTSVSPATGSTDVVVNTLNGDGNPAPAPPPPRKEFKSRHKPLPPPPPKLDLSKVKSKLSVPTAASANRRAPKRDSSPAPNKPGGPSAGPSRDSSPATGPVTRSKAASKVDRGRASEGNIVLVRQRLNSTTNTVDSVRSSRTDLTCNSREGSVTDEGTSSKATSITENGVKRDHRRHSNISLKSGQSEKSKIRNGDVESVRKTRATAKTTSRPSTNSPARISAPRTIEIRLDHSPANSSSRRSSASPTPVIVRGVTRVKANGHADPGRQGQSSNKPPVPSARGRNSVISIKVVVVITVV